MQHHRSKSQRLPSVTESTGDLVPGNNTSLVSDATQAFYHALAHASLYQSP